MKISEAKEALSVAMALREALIRMRRLFGVNASALVCERHAEELLQGHAAASVLSEAELRALSKRLGKQANLLPKIVAVIGDRVMHIGEIHRSVVAAGVPDHGSLRQYISNRLSMNSAGKGEELFVKVRWGWYRLRKKGETTLSRPRLKKGELIQIIYDVMGKDALNANEISTRLTVGKLLPPDRCEPDRIKSVLINHSVRGTQCLKRDSQDSSKFRAVAGRRPSVDVSELMTMQIVCTIIGNRTLSSSEIHERFRSRKGAGDARLSLHGMDTLLARNTGNAGRRMFERVAPRVYKVARHIVVLEHILTALGSRQLTAAAVSKIIRDTGHEVPQSIVNNVMRRNAGAGMPLTRIAKGIYACNRDYKK